MHGLCKCDDPRLSKRVKIQFFSAVITGMLLAYGTLLIVASVAKELLK